MNDKLETKIITRSGKTHMLSVTEMEYVELLSLIDGNKNYVVIKLSTGSAIFTQNSIETLVVYHDN